MSTETDSPSDGHGRDCAVVIGGSVAGLLAARVLSGHFERVTIVERDRLPEEIENRRGGPSSDRLLRNRCIPGSTDRR